MLWLYKYLVQTYSPEVVEFLGTSFIQFITIWALGLLFILIDLFGLLARHKIHPPSEQPIRSTLWQCYFGVLRNQLIMSSLHLIELFLLHRLVPHPWTLRFEPQLPPLKEILSDLLLCALIREVLFYYGHRALHHPFLYRRFHKQHHRFMVPVALASQYCHPVELVIVNIVPIVAPARLLKVHILTFWLFLTGSGLKASLSHSGYDVDLFVKHPNFHDLHHKKLSVNYGLMGWLDTLHGTRYSAD